MRIPPGHRSRYTLADKLTVALIAVFLCVGMVLNVRTICKSNTVDSKVMLRVVGIFIPPLGAILGYIK